MNSLTLYINSIRNRILFLPFLWAVLFGIALLFFKEVEYFSILIVLVCYTTMDKNRFRILSVMPIKTKDIIKIPFISSYIASGIVHLILIGYSLVNGENKITAYLTILTVSLVIMNLVIPVTFISEMAVDDGGGVWIITVLLMLLGIAINYGIVVGFDRNSILTIMIDILLVFITSKLSYKWTVNNVYGKR